VSLQYRAERIALLTQHGKERVIAPRFRESLGARVERVAGYDTDRLGTFTREIPRLGTQLEAARKKARIGMQLSGLSLGLASEGSFGADPILGLLPWNVELVILIDDRQALEIVGRAQAPARHDHATLANRTELDAFARKAGFPAHALVLRPEGEENPPFSKGIADWASLHDSFDRAQQASATGRVLGETDLRAHANPTRLRTIAQATDDLIDRIRSLCPACGTPGFWCVERITGLPCAACGAATREPRAQRFACLRCAYEEVRELGVANEKADPGHCDFCNP
jgi:hypothetical protein